MPSVLVFSSVGSFHAASELDAYVRPTYDEDGIVKVSDFMQEVGLSEYEPSCIEAVWEERAVPLRELIESSSYFEQWAHLVPEILCVDSVVLVYAPNVVADPAGAKRVRFEAALPYSPAQ
jgi:hypothetical protein